MTLNLYEAKTQLSALVDPAAAAAAEACRPGQRRFCPMIWT
jgi:hypothetical protein